MRGRITPNKNHSLHRRHHPHRLKSVYLHSCLPRNIHSLARHQHSRQHIGKRFSAYYVGAWRFWHTPSQIYHFGALGGAEPFTPPYPQAYKYLPSFLLLISPLIPLDYQQALLVFDIIQLMLLPAMAYMLYKLLDNKHVAVTFAVMVVALLLPFPSPNGGLSMSY